MFHYAIPLRAKQTSNDWNEVCVRLEATIKSIEGRVATIALSLHVMTFLSL